MKNISYSTANWLAYYTYEYELPISKWNALKSFVRGTSKIRYKLPYNSKRKGIYIKGRRLTK